MPTLAVAPLKFLSWLLGLVASRRFQQSYSHLVKVLQRLYSSFYSSGSGSSSVFPSSVIDESTEDTAVVATGVPAISVAGFPDSAPSPHSVSLSLNAVGRTPSLPGLRPDHGTQTRGSGWVGSVNSASNSDAPSITAVGGSPTVPITSIQGPDPIPFAASQIDRYNRDVVKKLATGVPVIRPGRRTFEDPKGNETSWESCVHPEGALYFHDTKNHIFTDFDIRKSKNRIAIEGWFERIVHIASQHGIVIPDINIDITFELGPELGMGTRQRQCRYYCVDKNKKLLFWLHHFDPTMIYGNVKGVRGELHIKCALKVQYWMHCELYPHKQVFCQDVLHRLRGIIVHANAEKITSETSLAPFETDELSKMMDIMDVLESEETIHLSESDHLLRRYVGCTNKENDHLMCVVARFMRTFTRVHFMNFHGQTNARLDADQPIHDTREERARTSVLLRVINPILFGAPAVHWEDLGRVWVDQTLNQPRWKAFIGNMISEWAGFTVFSTVMLAVDVSFLVVPGVEPQNPNSDPQPVGVVAIYISILCTIGSLVASIILSRQSRRTGYTADATASYVEAMTSTLLGIDHLAIMYSVPYGLLMWGMISYVVALCDVIIRSAHPTTSILIGIIALPIMVLGLWPTWDGKGVVSLFRITSTGRKGERDGGV
ncbi:hypothetical protein BDN67DRAFT_936435 [Paxillus ammoniavirescens]|nr:hypothetical protein BDN67DRAFT_936435 [Paxillus ammoniavirescens]